MTKLRSVLAILLGLFAVLTLLDRFVLVELLLRRTAIPLLLAAAMALAMAGFGALFAAREADRPAARSADRLSAVRHALLSRRRR